MKIYLTTLLLCFTALEIFAQKDVTVLNGYKYVYVAPLKYQDGNQDKYGVRSKVIENLKSSGFTILETLTSPQDVDICFVISCIIDHTNNFYQPVPDRVYLKFVNCNAETVLTIEGESNSTMMVYTPEKGLKQALKRAFSHFDKYHYYYDDSKSYIKQAEKTLPKVETTNESEATLKNYFDSTKLNVIEGIYKSYQSEKMGYYKFAIKKRDEKFIAIIIETDNKIWKPGEVKAIFEPSSMNGFYSVKWYMGNKMSLETFGAMENEALLSIEFKDQSGEKRQDKFIKMYPASDNSRATFKKSGGISGSGFFVSTNGLIATNAHVIEGANNIEVNVSNEIGNFNYKAKLVLIDSKNDVALIRIEDDKFKGLTSLPYGISEKADIGEKSFTIGYPLNDIMGSNYKLTDGIISAKSGIADDVRYFQISVPLQPGNSGGPLFNSQGNIIGITSAKLNSKAVGTKIENVNYAIKATYLISLMNMLPSSNVPAPSNQLANKELKEQVKILKNYVCLIQITE